MILGGDYMAKKTLKTFGMVMDNTADIKSIVINKFFKLLDLGNNDLLNEFVMEKLLEFDFCMAQDKFISKIQEIINQGFNKLENANGTIDYGKFESDLKNSLQQIRIEDFKLENDIKNLALQISDKFPQIPREAILEKFFSNQELLKEIILSTNKNVISTLVNMTPQLVQDLKQLELETKKKEEVQQTPTNINNEGQQQNITQINPNEVIQQIRKEIVAKSKSIISTIQSTNPFNKFNPITINEFNDKIKKYGIDIDKSYIEGVVQQINIELFRYLINKAKDNIINDLFKSTSSKIELLKIEDIINNYKFKLNNEDMIEIVQYVNDRVIYENRKRPDNNISGIQRVKIEQVDMKSLETTQGTKIDLFEQDEDYKKLYDHYLELATTETQKDAIRQIMTSGKYNGFKLNTMLSNKKDNIDIERKRRISFVEMLLLDENLFLNLANSGLNCFHGTSISVLETILNNGLHSSKELYKMGIELKTGEENAYNSVLDEVYGSADIDSKRGFISLTDDFNASVNYAGFHTKEQIEFIKNNYGKELKNEPIIVCFNGNDIYQKYSDSLAYVESMYTEIGITRSIEPSDINCIITSPEKLTEVQAIVSKYGIKVLTYDCDKFKNFNKSIEERKNIISSETKDTSTVDGYDAMMNELEKNQTEGNTNNNLSNSKLLNEDANMKLASDIKMDIVFNLTEQYNASGSMITITPNDLIDKYNMNENVAQNIALEINTLVENYIREKEIQNQNYTPYVLDGFEEEQEVSHKHK